MSSSSSTICFLISDLPLLLCQRSVDCVKWVYFWALHSVPLIYLSVSGLSILSHWSICLFLGSPSCPTDLFVYLAPTLFCFDFVLALLGHKNVSPYTFKNRFVDIHKITCWNFYWDCLEPIDKVEKNWLLDSIVSSLSMNMEYLSIFFFWWR